MSTNMVQATQFIVGSYYYYVDTDQLFYCSEIDKQGHSTLVNLLDKMSYVNLRWHVESYYQIPFFEINKLKQEQPELFI